MTKQKKNETPQLPLRDPGSNGTADAEDAKGGAEPETKRYEAFQRDQAPEVYDLLDDLIAQHHASDLADASVGLAWWYDVKPDRDGGVRAGKAIKVSAREREFHEHDFVVLLNFETWQACPPPIRRAILDHELEHCGRIENEDGSSRYYARKHDLEEFTSIVRRHGLWRDEVKRFVEAATGKPTEPGLFDEPESTPKVTAGTPSGMKTLKTCAKMGGSITLEHAGKSVTLDAKGGQR